MSHFLMYVIQESDKMIPRTSPRNDIDTLLEPFIEHFDKTEDEQNSPYFKFKSTEEEYLEEYYTGTTKEFYDNSSCSHGKQLAPEDFKSLKDACVGEIVEICINEI